VFQPSTDVGPGWKTAWSRSVVGSDLLDIDMRDEEVRVGAVEHNDGDTLVGLQPIDKFLKLAHHASGVQVDGGIVECYSPIGGSDLRHGEGGAGRGVGCGHGYCSFSVVRPQMRGQCD
jgi:hypothetical protein